MATMIVPRSLASWLGGCTEAACVGRTVGECVQELEESFPGFRERVIDETGQIRATVLFFLNGDSVRDRGGVDAPVGEGDEMSVVPLAAGG